MQYDWPSPLTERTLTECGWSPDRRVDMSSTIRTLESIGYHFSPESVDILSNFGGLWIYPPEIESAQWAGDPVQFDPMDPFEGLPEQYFSLQERLGQTLSPLGRSGGEMGYSILADGRLIGDWTAGVLVLGNTFTEGMDLIVRRYRQPEWLVKY
ncbi:SUKH-3 domain-containing protein [Nocardia sp. NPDC058176]|uniref:SUKH-3 domain-containing protein n=1 Tax=Nocardia sp. NPDC058176 TaxID=3346368 RepID=UPI0036DAFA70